MNMNMTPDQMGATGDRSDAVVGHSGGSDKPATSAPKPTGRSRGLVVGLVLAFLLSAGAGAVIGTPESAEAHSPWVYKHHNRCPHFYSYQHGWGGIYTTAGINFQPDDLCNGRHVKQAWVRVYQTGPAWRCWPHSDSGRRYTSRSSHPHTEVWHWAHIQSVKDSVQWGCSLKAHYNYWTY